MRVATASLSLPRHPLARLALGLLGVGLLAVASLAVLAVAAVAFTGWGLKRWLGGQPPAVTPAAAGNVLEGDFRVVTAATDDAARRLARPDAAGTDHGRSKPPAGASTPMDAESSSR